MEEATLTSKSQLTLPKRVRESLNAVAGDRIQFVPSRNGFRIVLIKGDITKLRGMFKGRRGKPLSIAQMNQAITEMGSRKERSR